MFRVYSYSLLLGLDRWDQEQVRFVFGIDALPNLVLLAQALPATAWQTLCRPPKYEVATQRRRRPHHVKEEVVRSKGYKNLRRVGEQVAEFRYRPGACQKDYRMVVLRKEIVVERGGREIERQVRYFFYITNEWELAVRLRFRGGFKNG